MAALAAYQEIKQHGLSCGDCLVVVGTHEADARAECLGVSALLVRLPTRQHECGAVRVR